MTGASVAVDAPLADELRLRLSMLEVVFGQARPAVGVSLGVTGLVCAALWEVTERSRLLVWLLATVAVVIVRYSTIAAFRRRRPGSGVVFWEVLFVGSLTLASLVWGFGSLYVLPHESSFHQVLVFSFLLGMAAGSALLYCAHKLTGILSLLAMLTPMTLVFALRPEPGFRFLAVGGAILAMLGIRAILGTGEFIRRSFALSLELEKARRSAELLARTDPLTGLMNRRAFYEMGEYLLAQAARLDHPLALLLIDVDDFKEVNDRHGHAAGDAVLRSLAATARKSCRDVDLVGRLGGDEFAILLPDAPAESAVACADRLRHGLADAVPWEDGCDLSFTCSIGVAARVPSESFDELVRRADESLYEAKRLGRDRRSGR